MTKDVQLAEDLSQETFLKIYINIGKFKGASSIKTWCLKIARNTFLTHARKKQPVLLEEQELELEINFYKNDPVENVLQKEREEHIKKIMMTLNEQDRTILLLRDYEELSYEEIAQVLNVSGDIVKGRLYRARQKFRQHYQKSNENND